MTNIWFTSDTHFNHENIVQLSSRPFSCLQEMTEALIENWNANIKRGDLVYCLGDFLLSWGSKSKPELDRILSQLEGEKYLIAGNHDRQEVKTHRAWRKVYDFYEKKVDLGGLHKQRIVMCHYPLMSWNQMHRGSWMLHGHCHGNLKTNGGKILDVGVDVHGYAPVNIETIAQYMDKQSILARDHHV